MKKDNVIAIEEIKQTKSKERVKDFGEVFTNPREVKAMLDLVKEESYKVDSRFLEPACGNGNFLVEIIDRKMKVIEKAREAGDVNQVGWESMALTAVGSVYGIDIQEDNCEESRERMLAIVLTYYSDAYGVKLEGRLAPFTSALEYLMEKNIIHGDGLTGLRDDGSPITFSEWEVVSREEVIRKDYEMNAIIEHNRAQEARKRIESSDDSLFALLRQEEETPIEEVKHSKMVIYAEGSVFTVED